MSGTVQWQFGQVVEAFLDLVEARNECKLTNPPSREAVKSDLCKLYNKRFVPFLHMLGIEAPCMPSFTGDLTPGVPPVSLLCMTCRERESHLLRPLT